MVNKFIHESGKGKEKINIIRYEGSQNIRKMIDEKKLIEAFVHTQLGIERILWNKVVCLFEGEKAMIVRRTIEETRKGNYKIYTKTAELIKWSHFLGAIDINEFNDLINFNQKRNHLMHRHGEWWDFNNYKEALERGIEFLEKNNF
jgi:hypothetical protein